MKEFYSVINNLKVKKKKKAELKRELKLIETKGLMMPKIYNFTEVRELVRSAREEVQEDVLNFIKNQRDNGNCEPIDRHTGKIRGFSAGICLSDLMKYLEEKLKNGK